MAAQQLLAVLCVATCASVYEVGPGAGVWVAGVAPAAAVPVDVEEACVPSAYGAVGAASVTPAV